MTALVFYLGYTSKLYRVLGFEYCTDDKVVIILECRKCGNIGRYRVNSDRRKEIKCKQCKSSEIFVPLRDETDEKGLVGLRFISRYQHRKDRAVEMEKDKE